MRKIFWMLCMMGIIMSFSNPSTNKKNYPNDYFQLPVKHKPYLAGTFGELRPNHFHSGIDIKSRTGKSGDPLYAPANGYVSRVKVQAGGYGNALYIAHPNGYTTVYAHLHKFTPEVAQYIKEQQYAQQKFEVDLYPEPNRFEFRQGQNIGQMGNTGRSYGPHLHFEIRDSYTEETINPLLFGIKVDDRIPPKLHQIKVYKLNDKHEKIGSFLKNVKKGSSGVHYVGGDTISVKAWRMGLAIKAYDHMNGIPNWNGVYSIETFVDGLSVHRTEFEKFSFDNTRYLNAHTDYREKLLNKAWFNRCYRMPGNDLPMYPTMINDGVFDLHSNKTQEVKIVVADANGNESKLVFWVKRAKEITPPKEENYNYFLPYNEDNYIDRGEMFLNFPKGAFYENLYLKCSTSPDLSATTYSSTHHIHNKNLPIHKWFRLGIRPSGIPSDKRSKAMIAKCGTGTPRSFGGQWEGDVLVAEARDLGDYCVMIDDIPPTITPIIFKSNMKGFSKMSFKLKENFKVSRKLDEFTWNGYIDGRWVLFTHNVKNDVITHRFEKSLAPGQHTLRLEASDSRGNIKVYERMFTR